MTNIITCFNEETCKTSKDNFFLGEWCLHWNKNNNVSKNKILPSHWNNKKRFKNDLRYIEDLYERLLKTLALKLNKMNSVNYDILSWRIIIGPWLHSFLISTYDKYKNLNTLINLKKIKKIKTEIIDYEINEMVPKNYREFVKIFLLSKSHIHFIYSELIKKIFFKNFKCKILKKKKEIEDLNINKVYHKNSLLNYLLNYLFFGSKKLSKIYFCDQYLSQKDKLLIKLSLKKINFNYDIFSERDFKFNISDFDENKRNDILRFTPKNKFEFFLKDNILKYIPLSYLEGFNTYLKKTKEIDNNKCNYIFASGAHLMNDFFKIWLVNNKKSKLYVVHHGGSFPQENLYLHKHENLISEKKITSFKPINKDYIQLPSIKVRNKKLNNLSGKKILLIAYDSALTIVRGGELFNSSDILIDFDQKYKLFKNLNTENKNNFKVRLFPFDYGWNLKERYCKKFKKDVLDKNSNLKASLKNTRIAINSYLDTPLSECMAMNVPNLTLILKDKREISRPFLSLYRDMKKNKLIFYDPGAASKQINKVYDNVQDWWSQKEIQKVVQNFKELLIFGNSTNTGKTWLKFLQNKI